MTDLTVQSKSRDTTEALTISMSYHNVIPLFKGNQSHSFICLSSITFWRRVTIRHPVIVILLTRSEKVVFLTQRHHSYPFSEEVRSINTMDHWKESVWLSDYGRYDTINIWCQFAWQSYCQPEKQNVKARPAKWHLIFINMLYDVTFITGVCGVLPLLDVLQTSWSTL